MAFRTLGRIVERDVDIGDRVRRGALLARLDGETLDGNVRAAEAAVSAWVGRAQRTVTCTWS